MNKKLDHKKKPYEITKTNTGYMISDDLVRLIIPCTNIEIDNRIVYLFQDKVYIGSITADDIENIDIMGGA